MSEHACNIRLEQVLSGKALAARSSCRAPLTKARLETWRITCTVCDWQEKAPTEKAAQQRAAQHRHTPHR